MKTQPYTTPPGTYDLPFTWAFDASDFVDGTDHPNSSVYLQGGYGDFQMRRAIGMNRFLAADGTGKFQIQRASKGSYIQSDPVQAPNTPEIAITPEEHYLETGKIWFDLFGILKPAQPLTSQIAFQGVRRMQGNLPPQPNYKANPKTYTYQVTATLTQVASPDGTPVVTKTPIVDYDFELHNIIILKSSSVSVFVSVGDNDIGIMGFGAKVAGVNIVTVPNFSGIPNVAPTIGVAGLRITFTQGTDAGGLPLVGVTTPAMSALIAATPAANALIATQPNGGTFAYVPTFLGPGPVTGTPSNFTFTVATISSGSGLSAITTPVCAMYVYDQNKVKISNIPILDIFYDGGPGSPYENGAVVPPLFYRKDSILEIDFYSMLTNPADLPAEVVVYLVGKQLYPCA